MRDVRLGFRFFKFFHIYICQHEISEIYRVSQEKCPLFLIYLYLRLRLDYFGSVSCKRYIHLCVNSVVAAKKIMMIT